MGWTHVAEGRNKWWALMNMVMSLRAALNSRNCLTGFGPVRLTIRTVVRGVSLHPIYQLLIKL